MKTFGDLSVSDIIYEVDLTDKLEIKPLAIVEAEDYGSFERCFVVERCDGIKDTYVFRRAFSADYSEDNARKVTKVWLADDMFNRFIELVFNCGIQYNKKQIREVLLG